jgi:hypothetical protein
VTVQPKLELSRTRKRSLLDQVSRDARMVCLKTAKFTWAGFIRVHSYVSVEDEDGYCIMTEITDTGKGVPASA